MVDLDQKLALPSQPLKHLARDPQNLRVGQHGVVRSGDVEVALVEFPHAPFGHGGLISPIHLGDVVALDVLHRRVHREPSGEWYRQVVPERAYLAALVV